MKIKIIKEIEVSDIEDNCGNCYFRSIDNCDLFDHVVLDYDIDEKCHARCKACLDAERSYAKRYDLANYSDAIHADIKEKMDAILEFLK